MGNPFLPIGYIHKITAAQFIFYQYTQKTLDNVGFYGLLYT
jgi:hypothetical protein